MSCRPKFGEDSMCMLFYIWPTLCLPVIVLTVEFDEGNLAEVFDGKYSNNMGMIRHNIGMHVSGNKIHLSM